MSEYTKAYVAAWKGVLNAVALMTATILSCVVVDILVK